MTTPAHCTRTWPAVSVCAAYDTGTHRCELSWRTDHDPHVCECGNVDVAARCTRTDPHMRHNVYDDAGMWLEVCPGVEPPADCCSHTWRTVGYCSGNDGGAHHCSALDSYHHVQHICVCGNVEPPADVAATPDPRLDVVARLVHEAECGCPHFDDHGTAHAFHAHRILDALDAMPRTVHTPWNHTIRECRDAVADWNATHAVFSAEDAPAGLTPAQEIRLRVFEASATDTELARMGSVAAWVEHGPDETSELPPDVVAELRLGVDEYHARKAAEARADLAEARLGHIADAVRDRGPDNGTTHEVLQNVAECLVWTPDDTATACAATGDGE